MVEIITDKKRMSFSVKKSKDVNVTLLKNEKLTLLRLSAFNLNKKEITSRLDSNYKELLISQNHIKKIMVERKWERVLLKAFKSGVLLLNDYTMDEVSTMAMIHAEVINNKIELSQDNYKNDFEVDLFLFVEETKNEILKNFKKRQTHIKRDKLSDREWNYLNLVLRGATQSEILSRLKVSITNLRNCKWTIFRFLGVKNWFNAIRMVYLLDLVKPSKRVKGIISNHIFESAKKINDLENISNNNTKRSLRIYILLITLFNTIEFNILFNRCDI